MNARQVSIAMSVLVIVVLMVSACSPAAATPAPAAMRQEAASGAAPAQPVAAPAPPTANSSASGATTAIKNPSSASPYQANRMIIKNGEMNLMVLNTDRTIDQVTGVAVDSGGYIVSAKTWVQDGYKYATISLGVPSDQFEAVQRQLRTLAVQVLADTASGQDVSDEYVDLQSRLTNLEATRARIREFLDKATKVEEALQVNAQLTEIEGQIEQVKGRMQYLKDRAAYSTILVNIEQQRPTPTPYPTATPTSWQPGETLSQAGDALGDILRGLGDLLIWLVVVVAPLAIPLVIVVLVVRRLRKKK
ncbi:MAG TPA: DUF4349 domain-containing protein [Anaerolineae bacterium]|nr:DUF4349 domain-containing protein [Anaerolineae bacterium]